MEKYLGKSEDNGKQFIVSPDEVRDTLVLDLSVSAMPLETVWFPEATNHNFKGIVFIFGIQQGS
jgi:hypothetical protein